MNDYISRQWLLDEYDKRHKGPPGGARKMIEEAPAADVRSVKWIPVAERRPEETGSYLVWMRWPHDESNVHSIINFDADCEAFGEWEEYYDPVSLGWAGSDFIEIENVYAWMPLPEPPKGGADE